MADHPIPTDEVELERWTFEKIGEFVYWFSRVEWMLRFALTQVLDLRPDISKAVLGPHDFSKLCDVTLAVCAVRGTHTDRELREVRKLISRCSHYTRCHA